MTGRKEYLLSVLRCRQFDAVLPFVEAHNKYRLARAPRESAETLTRGEDARRR